MNDIPRVPVYRWWSTVNIVTATDRGDFRRQPIDSHILGAQERLNWQGIYWIVVNIPVRITVGHRVRRCRQIPATPGMLKPRINRLRIRPRVMMNPTCRCWTYRSATTLDIQLRLKVRPVGAEGDLLMLLLLLLLLLLRVAQARQIGMRLRIARLRPETHSFYVLMIIMIILLTPWRLLCMILLLMKRAKLIGRTLNAIVFLLLPLLDS